MYTNSLNHTIQKQPLQWMRVNLKLRKVAEVGIFIQFMSQNVDSDIGIQLGHSTGTCQCSNTTHNQLTDSYIIYTQNK